MTATAPQQVPDPDPSALPPAADSWMAWVGTDWWATILGLVITAAAVAGALPKVGW